MFYTGNVFPSCPYILVKQDLLEGTMSEDKPNRTIRVDLAGLTGMIWFGGWLFTIAYTNLPFWQAVLALIIWPWHLGIAARGI